MNTIISEINGYLVTIAKYNRDCPLNQNPFGNYYLFKAIERKVNKHQNVTGIVIKRQDELNSSNKLAIRFEVVNAANFTRFLEQLPNDCLGKNSYLDVVIYCALDYVRELIMTENLEDPSDEFYAVFMQIETWHKEFSRLGYWRHSYQIFRFFRYGRMKCLSQYVYLCYFKIYCSLLETTNNLWLDVAEDQLGELLEKFHEAISQLDAAENKFLIRWFHTYAFHDLNSAIEVLSESLLESQDDLTRLNHLLSIRTSLLERFE